MSFGILTTKAYVGGLFQPMHSCNSGNAECSPPWTVPLGLHYPRAEIHHPPSTKHMMNEHQQPELELDELQVEPGADLLHPAKAEEFDWEAGLVKNVEQSITVASPASCHQGQPAFPLVPTLLSCLVPMRVRNKRATMLPIDFEPQPYSILCGQGNENYNAIGNRRFRVTVSMFLQRYREAKDRQEKSAIVTNVMDVLYETCSEGPFIKLKNGRWWVIDEKTAREKVGACFRDALADSYKSSGKSKIARRRHQAMARLGSTGSRRSSSSSSSTSSKTTSTTGGVPGVIAIDSDDSGSVFSSSQEG